MKIQFDEDEFYEIKIPEKVNPEEFSIILDKLTKLVKLMSIYQYTKINPQGESQSSTQIIRRYSTKNHFLDTREKVIDILQYHYHGTLEDRKRIEKIIGKSWIEINKRFSAKIIRFNIKPQEVGLTRWKLKRESPLIKLSIPNWTIKSHTGIFDENGN